MLLDGQPIRSCVTAVSRADGHSVTSLEGLRALDGLPSPDDLHPIQQAFVAEPAAQCGYCLSGPILYGYAFVCDNPGDAELMALLKLASTACCSAFDSLSDRGDGEDQLALGGPFPPEPTLRKLETLNNMLPHSDGMCGIHVGLSAIERHRAASEPAGVETRSIPNVTQSTPSRLTHQQELGSRSVSL